MSAAAVTALLNRGWGGVVVLPAKTACTKSTWVYAVYLQCLHVCAFIMCGCVSVCALFFLMHMDLCIFSSINLCVHTFCCIRYLSSNKEDRTHRINWCLCGTVVIDSSHILPSHLYSHMETRQHGKNNFSIRLLSMTLTLNVAACNRGHVYLVFQ